MKPVEILRVLYTLPSQSVSMGAHGSTPVKILNGVHWVHWIRWSDLNLGTIWGPFGDHLGPFGKFDQISFLLRHHSVITSKTF